MRQARNLMDKHGLTSVGLDVFKMGSAEVRTKNCKHPKWEADLASVVAGAFECTAFSGWRNVTFVGSAGAAEVASYTFEILHRRLVTAKASALNSAPVKHLSASRKRIFGKAFSEGWVYSVHKKVVEFARPVTGAAHDCHVEYLKTVENSRIGKARSRKSAVSGEDSASVLGAQLGVKSGSEVELHHGVAADRQPERLQGGAS